MDNIQERISYVKGLAEGLELFQDKKEGKFHSEVLEIISGLNQSLMKSNDRLNTLEEYVEAIDEDLNDIEWDYYDEEDLDDEIDQFELNSLDDELGEFDDEEHDDETYYQVICPSCNETVLVKHNLLDQDDIEQVTCPTCKELLIIEADENMVGTPQ